MKNGNSILEESYQFSLRIVQCYKYLKEENKEYEFSRQLLQSGASIGANAEESGGVQSKRDFIAKFLIFLKEAKECHYWIRLLRDSNYFLTEPANFLLTDCEEINKDSYLNH